MASRLADIPNLRSWATEAALTSTFNRSAATRFAALRARFSVDLFLCNPLSFPTRIIAVVLLVSMHDRQFFLFLRTLCAARPQMTTRRLSCSQSY
jgi:hypothetical protein